jgi:hypothetical protein
MHLTNREPIRSDALVASGHPDAAGAPANEIEVTPEMIEAGAMVIYCSNEIVDIGPTGAKNLSIAVIKAALEARSRGNFAGG